uniref:uncharacterized protein LOC122610751 n=1 Tax=Erigeron canadensis TaxID=72917 RepID=UPI001CB98BDC|nr:uncharacterized protein LOC122610751 [Erigeron canadensis]
MNTRASGKPLVSPQSNPGRARRRLLSLSNTEASTSNRIDPETAEQTGIQFSTDFLESGGVLKSGDSSEEEDNKDKTSIPGSAVILRVNQPVQARRMGDQEQPVNPNNRLYGDRRRNIPANRGNAIRSPATGLNFNLKGNHLKSVEEEKFDGVTNSDPYGHLERFEKICRFYNYGEGQNDIVKLELFPLTLCGEAKAWLKEQPDDLYSTWAELREGFIDEFYSVRTQRQLENKIRAFTQDAGEDVVDSWKRYKEMLRNCPGHNMTTEAVVEIFYDGLLRKTRRELAAAFGGSLNNVTPSEGYKILDDMAKEFSVREEIQSRKSGSKTVAKVESGEESRLVVEVKALSKQTNERFDNQDARFKSIERDVKVIADGCDYCGDYHNSEDCPDKPAQEVSYVRNQQQGSYSQNTGYQNRQSGTSYPSSSFNNTNNSRFGGNRFSRFSNQQNSNAELRDIMKDLISAQKATNEKVEEQSKKMHSAWDSMTTRLDGLTHKLEQSTKSTQATFQDIEAKLERLGNSNRQPGTLPSNTQQNPRPQQNNQGFGQKYSHPNARNEQVNAITTRACNTYNSSNPLPNDITPIVQVEADEAVDDEIEMEPNPAVKTPTVPSKTVEKNTVEKPPVKPYQPKIPFPQRLRKAKIKENFKKFVELIQNVNITIPLVDLLAGMPNYAKFLKELITDKKKLEETKTAVMSAECSAIIKNEIPPKLEDPGSFLISCSFGVRLYKALADLGASINLMPYSVYKRLSLDFVILEMEADVNVPLILGRPFLMTADAIIRVKAKEISLGVGEAG